MKKIIVIMLMMAMVFTLGACDTRPVETPPPVENGDVDGNGDENGDVVVDPEPEVGEVEVILYFVNEEYVMTGDESLEKVMPIEKTVTVGERPLEEMILIELQSQPQEEALSTTLENIRVLSVETAENIAYVNLSSEGLNGGSMQEQLVLQQILYSLLELEEVEAVQLLVDGSKKETLMGHIVIEEPLTKEDI